jgi:phosphonopyruvate decarboxylase
MIDPAGALHALTRAGIDFVTGVPDSLLKELNSCVVAEMDPERHVVAPNEGSAVALAAGHYLATGRLGLVYLQNSGLGNAVNPLISLASPSVYGIPIVLMIGWRGEPGTLDEPQHDHQGRITMELLELLDIPILKLTADQVGWEKDLSETVELARARSGPTAILVSAGTFAPYATSVSATPTATSLPSRAEGLRTVIDNASEDTVFVATTGYTARELAAIRAEGGDRGRDFLVVGSMGHASSIALGMALARPDVPVVCLDGDGAMAMHMGAVALIGNRQPTNFGHILFNNGVHESVGGQPTSFRGVDVIGLAKACGYRWARSCDDLDTLGDLVGSSESQGPWMVEVKVRQGSLTGLPRPGDFTERARGLLDSLTR